MTQRIGIIGGSGLGAALLAGGALESRTVETPFGQPSAPLFLGEWDGVPVALLARHGVGHTFPPSAIPFRANIWALKAVGCQWIIASGAVGSLREEIAPRDLAIADQVIDRTVHRASSFFAEAGAAVHVEMAEPFCEKLRQLLLAAAKETNLTGARVHERATYVCMEGPAFSTRAESLMHRQWGGDLIGMTAMPEAKLAREAEISYALVALATDYDCWRPHAAGSDRQALLTEIIGNVKAATENAMKLIRAAIPRIWETRAEHFEAHDALKLAIWTDKSKIGEADRQRLVLLWSRYM